MARGSWVGIVGVFGAAIVMCWTAVESWLDGAPRRRDRGYGLLLVVAASVALAGAAAAKGVELARRRHGREA